MSSPYPPPESPGHPGAPMPGSVPGMGAMPTPPPTVASAAPVPRPRAVTSAVRLMYAGAALSLLGVVLTPLMKDEVREQFEAGMAAEETQVIPPGQVDVMVNVIIAAGMAMGLLGVALWALMAWANGKGRSWARIVATILFGLNAVTTLIGLTQGGPPLQLGLSLLVVAVGAFAVFLLWQRESTQFFQAQSGPGY